MARHGMRHFVADHGREPGVVFGDGQDAAEDPDLAAGQAECVGRVGFVEQHELPLRIGQRGYGGDAFSDALQLRIGCRVLGDGGGFLEFFELLEAQLCLLGRADDQQLRTSGFRDRGTGREKRS